MKEVTMGLVVGILVFLIQWRSEVRSQHKYLSAIIEIQILGKPLNTNVKTGI